MRRLLLVALIVAGCTGAGATPGPTFQARATLHPGMSPDDSVFFLAPGRYRVTWSAIGCTGFRIQLLPTASRSGSVVVGTAPEVDVPVSTPTGEAIVSLPGGYVFINAGGGCNPNAGGPWSVSVAPTV